ASYILAWILGNAITVLAYLLQSRELFTLKIGRGTSIVETLYLSLPLIFSGSLGVINNMVDKAFVSLLPPGRVASLQYAHTLLGLITFTISAFQMTAYTELSELVVADDKNRVKERLRKTVTTSLNISLPLAAWIIMMAEPLVKVIYQRGEFDSNSTSLVSMALVGYGALIVLSPISHTCSSYFTARKRLKAITMVSVFSIFLNAFFDWLMLEPFGHAGIAASTSIVVLNATIIYVLLIRREGLNFMPYKRIPKLVGFSVAVYLVVLLLKFTTGTTLWLLLGNGLFFSLFFISAKSEIRAISSKIMSLFGRK
ncbi:MAG: lipid II flippase MurJ, partial [Kosmotogaceae bacterium]